jgi:hypothetical protein
MTSTCLLTLGDIMSELGEINCVCLIESDMSLT